MIPSYPKIYALGHRQLSGIFDGRVIVEEKVDGSQFSFGIYDGQLKCRSRSVELDLSDPPALFAGAVATAERLSPMLMNGYTYRGEALQKPRHNTLAYDRVPVGNIILFDIMTPNPEYYLDREAKEQEADRLGLEIVPILACGAFTSHDSLIGLLDNVSILGGQKIEGFVVKNNARFGPDGKPLFGKYVSEAFKEVHRKDYKARNPNRADVIETLVAQYNTTVRWDKAIQHLKEAGTLDESPKDIGPLMREVSQDIETECQDEIKEELWKHFRKQILKGVTIGLPEWYKKKLLESAF